VSQVVYRANLSAKSFPFISRNWGRTIVVPQYDNTFNRQVTSQEDTDKDAGIPQIYYCHNVMPNQQGLQSIGYTEIIPAFGGSLFTQIFLLRDGDGNRAYLGVASDGGFYILIGTTWTLKATYIAGALVTVAYVGGKSYIYVAGSGCYFYQFDIATLNPVTLTSLPVTGYLNTSVTPNVYVYPIDGISYAAGYMIAWSQNAVYWSSSLDGGQTDFTPSLVTGAGGGPVESARGIITACVAHSLGFIVYTENNCIASLYTANSRYPFQFREIVASGGLSSITLVSYDANTSNQYAYTTSGLQTVSSNQTQTFLPEVTDFVSGQLFEDYDESTDTFSYSTLTDTLKKQINMVSDRYLVVSYGITSLTHALVYDLITKRWGKLKVSHVQCFEYSLTSVAVKEIPRQSLAFLKADGSVSVVDFSTTSSSTSGVVCLGKYQFVRSRLLQLDSIEIENIPLGGTFSLYDAVALDGKNTSKITPTLTYTSGLFRRYALRAIGINHSLVLKGAFNLVSLVLTFNIHGKR